MSQYLEVVLGVYLRVILGGAGCRGWASGGSGDKSIGQVCRAVLHDLLHAGATFKEVRQDILTVCLWSFCLVLYHEHIDNSFYFYVINFVSPDMILVLSSLPITPSVFHGLLYCLFL